MTQNEYLAALRRALTGLPPDAAAKTLAHYEQQFVDGLGAGRAAAEIAAELGDPAKVAATLRASLHLRSFARRQGSGNIVRVLASALGLGVFNLFMLVPAMVYFAMLFAAFAASLGLYFGGIAIAASGLSGVNSLVLEGPLRQHFAEERGGAQGQPRTRTWIKFDNTSIQIEREPEADARRDQRADAKTDAEKDANSAMDGNADPASVPPRRHIRSVGIYTDHVPATFKFWSDALGDWRKAQTVIGLGLVLGSIVLFLLSLVVGKYTLLGLRRYVEATISVLKGR